MPNLQNPRTCVRSVLGRVWMMEWYSLEVHAKKPKLDLNYPEILTVLKRHLVPGRTESRAFLSWFLENFYRLDETDAQDSVCDGPDDKGVDGIYVRDTSGQIDIFQAKILQNKAKAIGDTALKEFVGTLSQFKDGSNIEKLSTTTTNTELAALIKDQRISERVAQGYTIRGIFVTNAPLDGNGTGFASSQPHLVVYSRKELQDTYVPTENTGPIASSITFDVAGYDCPEYRIGKDVKVVVAPLSATDLIRMDGISNGELFTWNVRQSLGRTDVNKAIADSIQNVSEHKNFLLYHNGLTVLATSVRQKGSKVEVSGYTVVNGCQSLTSLYDQRSKVSSELRVLTRLIEIPPDDELTSKITHHSNNQNGIKARDLQSNNPIQRRLQNEFAKVYSGRVFYRVKRGEDSQAPLVIDNELAGRILLAFDLKEPWSCHQSYKLFDELHSRIFGRPSVTAHRIYATHQIYQRVLQQLATLQSKLLADYVLTRYFLLYLLREALDTDAKGRQLCQDPRVFFATPTAENHTLSCIGDVLGEVIIEINNDVAEREKDGAGFDFKRELKSQKTVRSMAGTLIASYQRLVVRKRVPSFTDEMSKGKL